MSNIQLFIMLMMCTNNVIFSECETQNSTIKSDSEKSNLYIEAPSSLVKHTQEFNKEVITVLPGIHCAIGYGIANSMLIEGLDGNVIIDTLESRESAMELNIEFRKISTKPVVGIIYTHNHADHVFGAEVFAGPNLENVKVYSHSTTKTLIDVGLSIVEPINSQRSARQFGRFLTEETGHINNGVGLSSRYANTSTRGLLYPTHTFDNDTWYLTIAGRDFIFYHAPGETDDQIVIYMPKEEVLFSGDNVYKSFPNIYSIRGTTTRDTIRWASSIDLMRNLKPNYLIPSHTRPLSGKDNIFDVLTKYRDAIQFVHDQTVRFMNEGFTPDDIIGNKLIQLPKQLQENPHLQQFYGTVDWSIRAAFDRYMGWFSGKTSDLNPDSPVVRAENLMKLGGGNQRVFENAKAAYLEKKYQWCLELTEVLLLYPKSLNISDIKELQARSLEKLASFQTSANARNWYITRSLEIQGLIDVKQRPFQRAQSILRSSLANAFMLLPINLNYQLADGIDQLILFQFNDTKERFSVHIRNGIADIKDERSKHLSSNQIDMIIEMKEAKIWQQVIAHLKTATSAIMNNEMTVTDGNGKLLPSGRVQVEKFLALFTLK